LTIKSYKDLKKKSLTKPVARPPVLGSGKQLTEAQKEE
jgi:hypothetical protein